MAANPPPDDAGMWRRLLARAHPDAGGDQELFVWATEVREFVRKHNPGGLPVEVNTLTPPPAPTDKVGQRWLADDLLRAASGVKPKGPQFMDMGPLGPKRGR